MPVPVFRFTIGLFLLAIGLVDHPAAEPDDYGAWMSSPRSEWPQIAMINRIEYTDKSHPIAGCGFLLDTGDEVLAATAKHVLIYFRSERMDSVSFGDTLKMWKMFPKDNPADAVVIGKMINANPEESLDRVPTETDWLLFTVRERSPNIQPLRFRSGPLQPGEPVFIIGWRYSDKDCPQVVYEGNYVRSEDGSVLITTRELADNTMPGLSGSPVVDSDGYLIGLMSTKAGKMERLSSIDYPGRILGDRSRPED
jgi:hypothetical protein